MTLLKMSFYGAVIILAIILIRAFTLHKLPKKTFLILWGVALLRLLIPFEITSEYSVYSLVPEEVTEQFSRETAENETAEDAEKNTENTVDSTAQNNSVNHTDSDSQQNNSTVIQIPSSEITGNVSGNTQITNNTTENNTAADNSGNYLVIDPLPSTDTSTTESEAAITPELNPPAEFVDIIWKEQPTATDWLQDNPLFLPWIIGVVLCAAFFLFFYIRTYVEFADAIPVTDEYAREFLKHHWTNRVIRLRQSDKISAPLTYGIFCPVILLPKKMDWENHDQLDYVLYHEFTHIRRFDMIPKLLMAAALCLHWFNPFVWAMYYFFNRDIELSCDECVVKYYEENHTKADYARALISMEEKKSRLTPLCNNFSKNAIEERITAIMKLKKTTIDMIIVGIVIVAAVVITLTTSAKEPEETVTDVPTATPAPTMVPFKMIDFESGEFDEEELAKALWQRYEEFATVYNTCINKSMNKDPYTEEDFVELEIDQDKMIFVEQYLPVADSRFPTMQAVKDYVETVCTKEGSDFFLSSTFLNLYRPDEGYERSPKYVEQDGVLYTKPYDMQAPLLYTAGEPTVYRGEVFFYLLEDNRVAMYARNNPTDSIYRTYFKQENGIWYVDDLSLDMHGIPDKDGNTLYRFSVPMEELAGVGANGSEATPPLESTLTEEEAETIATKTFFTYMTMYEEFFYTSLACADILSADDWVTINGEGGYTKVIDERFPTLASVIEYMETICTPEFAEDLRNKNWHMDSGIPTLAELNGELYTYTYDFPGPRPEYRFTSISCDQADTITLEYHGYVDTYVNVYETGTMTLQRIDGTWKVTSHEYAYNNNFETETTAPASDWYEAVQAMQHGEAPANLIQTEESLSLKKGILNHTQPTPENGNICTITFLQYGEEKQQVLRDVTLDLSSYASDRKWVEKGIFYEEEKNCIYIVFVRSYEEQNVPAAEGAGVLLAAIPTDKPESYSIMALGTNTEPNLPPPEFYYNTKIGNMIYLGDSSWSCDLWAINTDTMELISLEYVNNAIDEQASSFLGDNGFGAEHDATHHVLCEVDGLTIYSADIAYAFDNCPTYFTIYHAYDDAELVGKVIQKHLIPMYDRATQTPTDAFTISMEDIVDIAKEQLAALYPALAENPIDPYHITSVHMIDIYTIQVTYQSSAFDEINMVTTGTLDLCYNFKTGSWEMESHKTEGPVSLENPVVPIWQQVARSAIGILYGETDAYDVAKRETAVLSLKDFGLQDLNIDLSAYSTDREWWENGAFYDEEKDFYYVIYVLSAHTEVSDGPGILFVTVPADQPKNYTVTPVGDAGELASSALWFDTPVKVGTNIYFNSGQHDAPMWFIDTITMRLHSLAYVNDALDARAGAYLSSKGMGTSCDAVYHVEGQMGDHVVFSAEISHAFDLGLPYFTVYFVYHNNRLAGELPLVAEYIDEHTLPLQNGVLTPEEDVIWLTLDEFVQAATECFDAYYNSPSGDSENKPYQITSIHMTAPNTAQVDFIITESEEFKVYTDGNATLEYDFEKGAWYVRFYREYPPDYLAALGAFPTLEAEQVIVSEKNWNLAAIDEESLPRFTELVSAGGKVTGEASDSINIGRFYTVSLEGIEYFFLGEDASTRDDRAWHLAITTPDYPLSGGAKVGMTVKELLALYPDLAKTELDWDDIVFQALYGPSMFNFRDDQFPESFLATYDYAYTAYLKKGHDGLPVCIAFLIKNDSVAAITVYMPTAD